MCCARQAMLACVLNSAARATALGAYVRGDTRASPGDKVFDRPTFISIQAHRDQLFSSVNSTMGKRK